MYAQQATVSIMQDLVLFHYSLLFPRPLARCYICTSGRNGKSVHSIAWHRKRCILRAICTQNTYFHIARYMHGLPVARNMRGVHYEYILRAICATFIIYRGHVQMLRNERKLGLAYCAQSARSVNHAHIPRNMHMTEWGPINCTARGTI